MLVTARLFNRGFLPENDPYTHFPTGSPYEVLDQLGRDLPSLLHNADARDYLRAQTLPTWQAAAGHPLPQLRLYYVRLGFIASGYINQIGAPACHVLPQNIAAPLCHACDLLQRPPMLSYDGYALYNWRRFNPELPIQLGNIDTLQNFVHLYDEHWFILVHVEIEALAATQLKAILAIAEQPTNSESINTQLEVISSALSQQISVLKRIPEKMSPALYFKTFRPYINGFDNVTFEGHHYAPLTQRGETGAQSSIIPSLITLLKIPHQPSELVNHLREMRRYMPAEHRALIYQLEATEAIKASAEPMIFDKVLENIAQFREIHYQWAQNYINARSNDALGTGGTPYMQWLKQLIDETRAYKFVVNVP